MIEMSNALCKVSRANKELMHAISELQGALIFFAVVLTLFTSKYLKIGIILLDSLRTPEDTAIHSILEQSRVIVSSL